MHLLLLSVMPQVTRMTLESTAQMETYARPAHTIRLRANDMTPTRMDVYHIRNHNASSHVLIIGIILCYNILDGSGKLTPKY